MRIDPRTVCPFCPMLMMAVSAGLAADRTPLDRTAWRPRAASITISQVTGQAAGASERLGVRIQGRIVEGWNYAQTERIALAGGRLYRLSAWVRVDRAGPGTPMPYLKCEFVPQSGRGTLGQARTESYDPSRMGDWQQLVGEFPAPETTGWCWLALEKGSREPAEIDARLSGVTIEPIARLSIFDRYRLKPVPASLEKVRGVHPRIYLDRQRIARLRVALPTTHRRLWEEVRQRADRAARRGPPAYILEDRQSGSEQLWQREVGNTMPVLAMAYLLTGERQYLDAARRWALASCSYKTWGLGHYDGMDLATGHQLFGLGIVYDWCYQGLGEEARRTIRETLARRASAMFEAAATDKAGWRRSYLQNHLWVNIAGMAVAGMALFDEVDDASCWIGLPLDKFRRTMAALGPDGASHEGVGYWEYGVEYMLKFMDLARHRLDVDLYDYPWWRNTAAYGQYLSLPRRAWNQGNTIVDIADCPRGHWYGPDYLLRGLAREYRDPHAQWLAGQIEDARVASSGATWLNLVWFDPTVPEQAPDDLPTLRHFDDMDIVSARSDWSGEESLVVFKCGPYLGHKAVQEFSYDPGGGHVHPDANHFVLFGAGEWLVRDDGYRWKSTGQHNTLVVDGRGQLGEGRQWFAGLEPLSRKARPRILRAASTPPLDQITGDATEAYPSELGLKRYVRHLLFLKPDVLIVVDDIALDGDHLLELRFHPEQQSAQRGQNAFLVRGKRASLRLEPLTAEGVDIRDEMTAAAGRHGEKDAGMFAVRLETRRSQWRNAVALSWAAAGQEPGQVTLRMAGDRWEFDAQGRTATLDWKTGAAEVNKTQR